MKTKIAFVANKFLKWKAKALYILYLHYKVNEHRYTEKKMKHIHRILNFWVSTKVGKSIDKCKGILYKLCTLATYKWIFVFPHPLS